MKIRFFFPSLVIYVGHICAFLRILLLIKLLPPISFNFFSSSYALSTLFAACYSFGDNEKIILNKGSFSEDSDTSRLIISKLLVAIIALFVFLFIPTWFHQAIYSCCGAFSFAQYLANLSLAIAQSALSVLSYSFLYLLRQFISLICLLPWPSLF